MGSNINYMQVVLCMITELHIILLRSIQQEMLFEENICENYHAKCVTDFCKEYQR